VAERIEYLLPDIQTLDNMQDLMIILQYLADSAKIWEAASDSEEHSDFSPEYWSGVYSGLMIAVEHLQDIVSHTTGAWVTAQSTASAPDHTPRYNAAA